MCRADFIKPREGLQAKYSEAAEAAPPGAKEIAVYFANRAACQLKLRQWGPAASDCTRALEVDPAYLKALLRRCTAYEELDDLEKALTDAKKVCGSSLSQWPSQQSCSHAPLLDHCSRSARNMLGKDAAWCLIPDWPVCRRSSELDPEQRGDGSQSPPSRTHRRGATREDEGGDDGCVL